MLLQNSLQRFCSPLTLQTPALKSLDPVQDLRIHTYKMRMPPHPFRCTRAAKDSLPDAFPSCIAVCFVAVPKQVVLCVGVSGLVGQVNTLPRLCDARRGGKISVPVKTPDERSLIHTVQRLHSTASVAAMVPAMVPRPAKLTMNPLQGLLLPSHFCSRALLLLQSVLSHDCRPQCSWNIKGNLCFHCIARMRPRDEEESSG
jgi:hypothetical protein|mmetsp:Transcript_40477/g.67598  ORF Transcript_40477/g.67598 Transcript_40477/m.67598 type:complete len:201 (+) Transcript_40477:1713-2315(+)